MKETQSLLDQHRYIRKRLLGLLAEISAHPAAEEALHWQMPMGQGRAHMAWQFMHCAATYDRYINVRLMKGEPSNKSLVEHYAGGSKPDSSVKVKAEEIQSALTEATAFFYDFFERLPEERLLDKPDPDVDRTYREILHLLNWHEAEHAGQIQLTWNAFRAQKGLL